MVNKILILWYIGKDWKLRSSRLTVESQLLTQNSDRWYNVFDSYELRTGELNSFYQKRHSEKTKALMSTIKKGIPNNVLGAKVSIEGKICPSIAQASRSLNHSRKLIRTRVDSSDFPEWKRLSDS